MGFYGIILFIIIVSYYYYYYHYYYYYIVYVLHDIPPERIFFFMLPEVNLMKIIFKNLFKIFHCISTHADLKNITKRKNVASLKQATT